MKKTSLILIGAALAVFAAAAGTQLTAALTGANGAKGKAKFKSAISGAKVQAELQVEGEHVAPNATFTITVGNAVSATATSDALGKVTFKQRWTSLPLPTIVAGDAVTVTGAGGTTVLSGTFN